MNLAGLLACLFVQPSHPLYANSGFWSMHARKYFGTTYSCGNSFGF